MAVFCQSAHVRLFSLLCLPFLGVHSIHAAALRPAPTEDVVRRIEKKLNHPATIAAFPLRGQHRWVRAQVETHTYLPAIHDGTSDVNDLSISLRTALDKAVWGHPHDYSAFTSPKKGMRFNCRQAILLYGTLARYWQPSAVALVHENLRVMTLAFERKAQDAFDRVSLPRDLKQASLAPQRLAVRYYNAAADWAMGLSGPRGPGRSSG